MFVYNPELSDQDADEICGLILSSEMTNGIMLIISNSKIQGTINTSSISERLTRLEIFNLAVNINQKCSDHMQTSPWKGILCYDSNNDDLINNTFIELLHKITCNKWSWQLRIMLIEKDVLIAHKVNYEYISEKTRIYQSLKAIYLSDCKIESKDYQMLFDTKRMLKNLCIFNCHICQNWLEMNILGTFLERNLEISICNISKHIDDKALYNFITSKNLFYQSTVNFVIIMKNFMCGYNITEDQLCLLQSQDLSNLEHSILTLVSDTKQMHENVFFVFQNKQLTALHFIEKAAQASFVTKLVAVLEGTSNLRWFGIDEFTITSEAANGIVAILSNNKELEHLYLNSKLQTTDLLTTMKALSGELKNLKKFEITDITDQVVEYLTTIISHNVHLLTFSIANGNLCITNTIKVFKALQELTFTGSNITAEVTDYVAAAIHSNSQLQKVKFSKYNLQLTGTLKFTKALKTICTLTKLYINGNRLTDEAADDIATAICSNPQLQELNIGENNLRSTGAINIAKALQNISTLIKLYISNNNITDEAVDDIAAALSCNTQLQELDISNNWFQTVGIMTIAKSLQSTVTLVKLCIGDYRLSDEATDSIAAVLYCNTKLQELDIRLTNFGVICITRALCKNGTLKVLRMKNYKFTHKATESIAAAISSNPGLQILRY